MYGNHNILSGCEYKYLAAIQCIIVLFVTVKQVESMMLWNYYLLYFLELSF